MRLPFAATLLALALAGPAGATPMTVSPNGARPSAPGPAANFTGTVTVTPLIMPTDASNAGGGMVEFALGARSFWHSHPAGQTLIVTAGSGWVQEEGGETIAIKPGDVVITPPGVKHRHGATAGSSMSHIAITPTAGGKNVDWLEAVSDEQYR